MEKSFILFELGEAVRRDAGAEIERLHLRRVVIGVFFTGVELDDGAGGLCATPIKSIPEAVCCPSSARAMPLPGKLAGMPVLRALEDLAQPEGLRRALAIATLNALVESVWRRDGPPASATAREGDAFDALDLGEGCRVALVGAFPPYMRELRKRGLAFSVLERDPSTLRPEELPHYVPAERAEEVVPAADVLVTTGTALVNGTLDGLLALVRSGAQVAVVGPTAPLFPGPFFRRGVTVLGGTRVTDAGRLLDLLAEGGSGYHLFGDAVERVTLTPNPS